MDEAMKKAMRKQFPIYITENGEELDSLAIYESDPEGLYSGTRFKLDENGRELYTYHKDQNGKRGSTGHWVIWGWIKDVKYED